jgi:hypothetical protein
MDDPSTMKTIPDLLLKCKICRSDLTAMDKQKTTEKYWKNCQRCREKNKTAASYRKRLLARAISPIDAPTDNPKKKQKENPNQIPESGTEFCRFPRTLTTETSSRPSSIASSNLTPLPRLDATLNTPERPRDTFNSSDHSDSDSENLHLAPSLMEEQPLAQTIWSDNEEPANGDNRADIGIGRAVDETPEPTVLEPPSEKECSACADYLPAHLFPRLAGCGHDPDVCHVCFLQWLDQQMASAESVMCPSSECNSAVIYEDVCKYASQDVLTR